MLLDEIPAFLAASTGLGLTVATSSGGNLYKVPFPEAAPDAAVCVIEYAGGAPIRAMGASTTAPVAEVVRFQVLVRKGQQGFEAGRQLIEDIYQTLDHLADQTLTSTYYLYVRAVQSPFFLSFDGNLRPRFVANFEAMKRRES